MNIYKTLMGVAATVGLMMTVAGAQAQTLTAIGISGGNTAGSNVDFTGTPGGNVTVFDTDAFFNSKIGLGGATPVTVSLTTSAPGAYTFASGTGAFTQAFGSGTFTVTDNTTSAILLQGTFLNSSLSGINGGTSGGLNLATSSVTYGAGTKMGSFSPNNGSLTLEFNTVKTGGTDGFVASSAGLSAFTGVDGITYSAVSTVPEPGTVGAFAFTGLGMMGLMLRARKSRGNMAA